MATAVSTPVAQRRSAIALWHLFSLDAPTVAVVWTAFLSRLAGHPLPWNALAALGLAVWIIYISDRLLDSRHSGQETRREADSVLEERHRFHARHSFCFCLLLAFLVPVLASLVLLLPSGLRTLWPALGIPVALYALAVHALPVPRLPKELLVSLLFTAACVSPRLLARPPHPADIAAALVLLALCSLNSTAIARWERAEIFQTRSRDASAPAISPLVTCAARLFRPFVYIALALFALAALRLPALALPSAVTVAALLWIDRSTTLTALQRRSLADATLLTPLLLLPWLPLFGPA